MVQLRVLSGKMAGEIQIVRHFPFRIGRAAKNHLRLDEAGIWDEHLTLTFQRKAGFSLETAPEAFAAVNDQPQKSVRLRHGDIISFGSTKLQFWLAPAPLRGLRLREGFVWATIMLITALQIVLIYELLR
jgi:pSer/pThr/pTyr-binding forkhead associated (FHA) protein